MLPCTQIRPPTAHDDPHFLPSLVRLRSLLLDESPESCRCSAILGDQSPPSAQIAYEMSFLRTAAPGRPRSLIADWKADDAWSQGLSREQVQAEATLGVAVSISRRTMADSNLGGVSPPDDRHRARRRRAVVLRSDRRQWRSRCCQSPTDPVERRSGHRICNQMTCR